MGLGRVDGAFEPLGVLGREERHVELVLLARHAGQLRAEREEVHLHPREHGVRPRVVMQFPANAGDVLLSGSLANGQQLVNHPLVVDVPLGSGHVVMFALRPFWRWQTQGAYSLVFNTILHWNDLDR